MKQCRYCGTMGNDDEKFCRNCGSRFDEGQQYSGQPQQGQNYNNPYPYNSPAGGPKKKDNTKTIVIAIVAVVVVLLVLAAFTLPNIIKVEEVANYRVEMSISNVSISDPDNGFQYAEKDGSGCLHTYLSYSCNNSTEIYHELGWCPTNGTNMTITDDHKTATFDTYSAKSQITMSIFLLVVTKTVSGSNHYDYVDLFDVTKYIQGEKPAGTHDYGATGVSFTVSELDHDQIVIKGDSNPKGTITLTFTFTKL